MTLLLYGALGGVLFLLPFDLIGRRGMSASEVGLTLLPFGLIIGLLSRLAGSVADRFGPKNLLVGGSLVTAVAVAAIARSAPDYWLGVFAPVTLMAFGMAAVVTPLTTVVMNSASDDQSGTASGVNNAASRVAGLISVAGLGALAGLIFTQQGAPPDARFGELKDVDAAIRAAVEPAFVTAYTTATAAAAVLAALAALIAQIGLTQSECTAGSPPPGIAPQRGSDG